MGKARAMARAHMGPTCQSFGLASRAGSLLSLPKAITGMRTLTRMLVNGFSLGGWLFASDMVGEGGNFN